MHDSSFEALLMQRLTEIHTSVENLRTEQADLKLDVAGLKLEADNTKEEKKVHAHNWGAIGGTMSALAILLIGKGVDY